MLKVNTPTLRRIPVAQQRAQALQARFKCYARPVLLQAGPGAVDAVAVDEYDVELWPLPLDVEEQGAPDETEDAPDYGTPATEAVLDAVSLESDVRAFDEAEKRARSLKWAASKVKRASCAITAYDAVLNDSSAFLSDATRRKLTANRHQADLTRDEIATRFWL